MNDVPIFKPQRSMGWIWPPLIALLLLATMLLVTTGMGLLTALPGGEGWMAVLLSTAIHLVILAILFERLRTVTLRKGEGAGQVEEVAYFRRERDGG
ncbi:MAG: hypothetical protein JXA93_25325 [Anaerolineae bacterium]|nr:hypothetical protein [Anaerolineae bacterium]